MKFKKTAGFIIFTVILAYMSCIFAAATSAFELGAFTVVSDNNQQNGWCTNGVDGIETNLTIDDLKENVTNLLFEFSEEIGNITLICFGDGNGWSWVETPVEVNGTRLSINVEDINGWEETMTGNSAKIILCNYSPSWDDIEIVRADLVMPGGSLPAEEEAPAPEPEADAAETAADTPVAAAPAVPPQTGDTGIVMCALAILLSGIAFASVKASAKKSR